MDILGFLDRLHARAHQNRWLARLAILTRILLALGTPSGLTKQTVDEEKPASS